MRITPVKLASTAQGQRARHRGSQQADQAQKADDLVGPQRRRGEKITPSNG